MTDVSTQPKTRPLLFMTPSAWLATSCRNPGASDQADGDFGFRAPVANAATCSGAATRNRFLVRFRVSNAMPGTLVAFYLEKR
jgi:hypothetical protein